MLLLLPDNWLRREYPCYGWWDVVYVALLFALIIAFSWLVLRNEKD